ncbi:sensor histidine kinase [Solibacillus sp. FSL W7-1472]|uniref:sensor histidine kinase n=1 Tax=Solibacillus sp. FSL W7-1472 TaxID=2921707 RepID=UPI0007FB41C5|nr:sensor histidine kinase [Solibacillus silvestris]OBW50245.1 histidine kinase [Solibacillus silvestris]
MIRLFIRQYISMMLFVIILQLLLNLILFLDKGFHDVSLLYLNIIWFTLVAGYFSLRYVKDRKLMKPYVKFKGNYFDVIHEDYKEQLANKNAKVQEQKQIVLERQDELLAWVHEMKSPLTAMQLLLEKVEKSEVKERIENEWLRLYLLLDQQLHATRLMTIELDNRIEKVHVKDVLIQEIKALRTWCFEKKIAFDLEVDDLTVHSDTKWLGFIVRQILSNAVKYSDVGGEVRITAHMTNEQAVLIIQDEGIGIKSEDLPRVFRKSYTGTIGRETSAATGMGLYLAKQAAESLHILLAIESKEGVGTTVKIAFPKMNDYQKTLGM